jgi:acetylxylan esterase
MAMAASMSLVSAQNATLNGTTGCATGIHMIVARGSAELPGEGRMGVVAGNVSLTIPGSTTATVNYPARFSNYAGSEGDGTAQFTLMIAAYVKLCPNTKIALMGYSQGGQALMDAICGTSEEGFVVSPDLSESFDSSVVAVVTFGDPSHVAGAPWYV